jgi:hypothetical protein
MQKKKPPFQVIPNRDVSGPKNWNESKEVPAEQGRDDTAQREVPTAAGLFRPADRHCRTTARYFDLGRSPASSRENGAAQYRGFGTLLARYVSPVH